MTYHGRIQNGQGVLDAAVTLPEGARVRIDLLDADGAETAEENVPSLYERLKPIIGMARGLPPPSVSQASTASLPPHPLG